MGARTGEALLAVSRAAGSDRGQCFGILRDGFSKTAAELWRRNVGLMVYRFKT
jgi:hypothetical protein